jgi:galactose mutarotase-like enzyme
VTEDRIELRAGPAAATIAPGDGGMLLSLEVNGRELLVQRREGFGPVPTFGSFVMAPWVAELSEGRLEVPGTRARMPINFGRHAIHGLVFDRPWRPMEVDATMATLVCDLGDPWPFGGQVRQQIALDASGITFELEVQAADRAMPAALGWHPWFAAPDPCHVRVGIDADRTLELDGELLPTGRVVRVDDGTDLRSTPIIGDRVLDTVYVGVTSPARVHLAGIDLTMAFDRQIDVVTVYVSPGAVCVEPWSAWTDAVRMEAAGHPTGLAVLAPGERLRRWTRWEWSKSMDNGGAR